MTAVQSSVHVSPFPTSLSGFPLSLPSTLVTHADSAFTPVSNDRGRLFSPMVRLYVYTVDKCNNWIDR